MTRSIFKSLFKYSECLNLRASRSHQTDLIKVMSILKIRGISVEISHSTILVSRF